MNAMHEGSTEIRSMPKDVENLKERLEKNAMGGVKDDSEKLLWSLIPYDAMEGVVKILMMGAKKYAPDNWRRVDRHRYVDALMRHMTAFMKGEVNDPESGCPHLWHAGCCVLFLIALYGHDPFTPPGKVA